MVRDHPWCDKQNTVAGKSNPAVTVGSAQGPRYWLSSEAGARPLQTPVSVNSGSVKGETTLQYYRQVRSSTTFAMSADSYLHRKMDVYANLHARNVHTYPPPSPYHRAALPAYSFAVSYLLLTGYIPLSDALRV
jgi:hypothetical protein